MGHTMISMVHRHNLYSTSLWRITISLKLYSLLYIYLSMGYTITLMVHRHNLYNTFLWLITILLKVDWSTLYDTNLWGSNNTYGT